MSQRKIIKNIAAISLLICFLLPLSRCTKKTIEVDPDGNVVKSVEPQTEYSYMIPIKEIKLDEPNSYIYLFVFIWPIPLWCLAKYTQNDKKLFLFFMIEAAFLCLSTYYIVIWTFYYGNPYWGGGLAVISISTLWVIYLMPIFQKIKMLIIRQI